MESAENREQPIKVSQSKKPSNSLSLSKAEAVELLNNSIDRLRQTIEKINDNPDSMPPSDSINTLLTTTQKLVDTVALDVTNPMPVPQTFLKDTASVPTQVKQKQSPSIKTKTPSVKEKQPAVVQKKNLGLIVIGVTAIAVAIVAVFWLWLPEQQTSLSPVSEPSVTEVITDRDKEVEAKETPTINPDSVALEKPAALESETELTSPVEIPIPQELETPKRAENLKVTTIEPKLTFTPEQTLIAALQTKLTELTKNYAKFVNSIEIDLPKSSLSVEVTDDWYELSQTRQNKLANDMLERSRQLDFSNLKLKDSTGKLVARNPVIGDKIIILQSDRL